MSPVRGNDAPSWYSASIDAPPSWPILDLDLAVDVCVIGGGFTGLNCAIELARGGCSVALIEARQIGWGASGRNGGQLIRGIGHDVERFHSLLGGSGILRLKQYGLEAVELVRQRIEEFAIDCDLRWGFADLANRPSHLEAFRREQEVLGKLGYRHALQLVEARQMHQVVDSERYCGALIDMGSGHLHPLKLALGEARVAEQLGVRLFERTPALEIQYGHHPSVQTPLGRIQCQRLVLACNAHLETLQPWLAGRVLPAGSYIIATQPLGERRARQLIPRNLALCDQRIALDYYRLSADHRLLFGGACHYSGRDPRDIAGYMRSKMLKVFPQLDDVQIEYAWGGMIGISANRLPQIGQLPGEPSVYYAQGYSGHGINTSHLAARLLAGAILGRERSGFDLFASVPHRSFPGGRWLRSPLLALGMLWARLCERL